MPNRYVPGRPNPYFPRHQFYGIPVGRSIQSISQAKLGYHVGPAATARAAIEMEILTPEYLWETFQQEAEDLIKANGDFIKDDVERNRRINAAYAKLWLADNRFQWAGLAAFASKQVGCGLLHAHRLSERSTDEIRSTVNWTGNSTEAAGVSVLPTMIRNGADYMYERLGFGNKHLFLDIYPLHRFYMERGLREFLLYLDKRQKIGDRIEWKARRLLKFGLPFEEIRVGFQRIEEGNLPKSVVSLARHEQVNVLQAIMYNDPSMQEALARNQLAWAMGFPSGVYTEIHLTLSAECKAKDGWTSYFSRLRNARLWVVEERMQFVNRAAERFDQLLRGWQRPYVEESLRAISSSRAEI